MKIYIVGAGPGEPELITLKGVKILKKADVVLYDNLVNEEILKNTKKDCLKIFCGKTRNKHFYPQDQINKLMFKYASGKKIVVRLKGGDPFIFGRGGEEVEFLLKKHIPVEVIPGVSSVEGCSAASLIPLSHRKINSFINIITAEEGPIKGKIEWNKISKKSTLVILMGVKRLKNIIMKLKENYWDPKTPVAIIQDGTLPTQKIFYGNIGNITKIAEDNNIKPPSIIIIGNVVKLGKRFKNYLKTIKSK